MACIADGYAALYEEDCESAIQSFGELADRESKPKFFLHWYWRMQAELGMSDAALGKGDFSGAHQAGDRFLQSALSTADPHLQVLAWNVGTRVAMAEQDPRRGEECLKAALAVLEKFRVPLAAWKVHQTAWQFYEHYGTKEAAAFHYAQAEAGVLAIAHSFLPEEPLRAAFLRAAPVQQILSGRFRIVD